MADQPSQNATSTAPPAGGQQASTGAPISTTKLCPFTDYRGQVPVTYTSACLSSTTSATTSSALTSSGISSQDIISQSSATSSSSGVPQLKNNGLSGGEVAGVAIGMFFAGLLIAGAAFFFLLRRQKKRQYGNFASHSSVPMQSQSATSHLEKGPAAVTSAVPPSIGDLLPQPVADDTITDMALKIRDNIKNHARSYYHASAVPTAQIHQTGLRELATATGVSTAAIASSLSDPSTRPDTLRLIIAWVLLSRCAGERKASLLPGELAALEGLILGKDGINPTQSAMRSKWKAMTGTLLNEQMNQGKLSPGLHDAFVSASAELDAIVEPFIKGDTDGQRRKNLDMILTRAANLAFLLFSQPGVFYFDFGGLNGGLVAFPALVQTVGDEGQSLKPIRVLLEKELAA